ncbi:hypothetical protein R5R35_011745 [Gryllus longicercus]|uniref:G-patch domain-containing protein n=1 Tax=Gryllus longicercus TaxID=2509291 RepID=A0AAN9YTB3_9ORTH
MVSDKKMSSHPNWRALATVAYPYKRFVHESRRNYDESEIGSITYSVSGVDSRAVYEEVLAEPSSNIREPNNSNLHSSKVPVVPKKAPTPHLDRNQWVNALMKEASANNVEGIKTLLGEAKELNVTDQFGWTMLMCAAHAGAINVVKYLLESGANTTVKDRGGNTCISLAKRQKHYEIHILLKNYQNNCVSKEEKPKAHEKINKIFCDVCKQHFEESPSRLHKNSTVHLFNTHPRKNSAWYGIPDSNKGFELMVKSGWNKELGLGPEGSGTKFPPKTILKRDRKGFGIDSGVARVTHFKPHDTRAVEAKNRSETKIKREQKRSIKSHVSSERRKERFLRRELNF